MEHFLPKQVYAKADLDGPAMPPEEALFFSDCLVNAKLYLEFGCGGSTLLAVSRKVPHVVSVESDAAFSNIIRERAIAIDSPTQLNILDIDIGPTGSWGYPLDERRRSSWPAYAEGIWRNLLDGLSPQFILIDGRFRVASLMATLLYAEPGSMIMFDDLKGRWNAYGALSAVIDPIRMVGRTGVFEVPSDFNKAFARHIFEKFSYDPR